MWGKEKEGKTCMEIHAKRNVEYIRHVSVNVWTAESIAWIT